MSNLIDNSYTQLNNLIQINADDIQTESINTKELYINNILFTPSGIDTSALVTLSTNQNITGSKTFSGTQVFSSIQLNSDLIVNSGGTTITNSQLQLIPNISTNTTDINDLKAKTTAISYNASNTSTSVLYALKASTFSFSSSINGYTTANFSTAINYGKDLTSSAQTQINSINTSLSNYVTSSSLTTTLNNYVLTTALNTTLNNYVLSTALNTTLNNYVLTTALNTTLNNYVLTTALNTTLANYALSSSVTSILTDKIGTMVYYEPTDFNIFNNICSLGQIQYTDAGNNKINIIPIILSSQDKLINVTRNDQYNYLDINSNANVYGNLKIGNIQNAESAINGAISTATGAATAAGIADGLAVAAGTLAGTANTTANGAAAAVADLATVVEGQGENITGLNYKTSQISYSDATDRTTVSQTLYSPLFELTTLASGFNQTSTEQITLAGLLRCNNRVEINNTLELVNNNSIIVEGIINQDNANPLNNAVNQFQAAVTMNGNVIMAGGNTTINSANTQIGVNATNNLNVNSTTAFGGDVSLLATRNLRLKNILPILFDDIVIGDIVANSAEDVIFNMQMVANRPVSINNTLQHGTALNRYSSTAYNTTSFIDANVNINLTSPIINLSAPQVNIGQLLGTNYLYGTTYVQNLYSTTGVVNAVGQVFQQW